ncbi:MAG: hypothetical protein QNJ98_02180 [Planctomycetota bacterium]|nr:hypothetical protein [Planctomycetota bacterium]
MSASDEKDLEALRTGLAELEPSPDLAETVAAIAREASSTARVRRFPGWLVPAAAALIVAGVLVARGMGSGPAGPEDDRILVDKFAGGIVIAPSPAEVAARRAKNTQVEPKAYEYMSFPQEEGVLLMGPELVVPDDAMIRGAGAQIEVHTQKGVWKPAAGTRYLELTLGSPGKNATTARVSCVLSTAYTGTLLVPDSLARALALHESEVPGGFVAKLGGQEQPIRGQRAMARVRIPELGVDRVVEVQTRAPHHPRDLGKPPKTGFKNEGAIVVSGALPSRVAHCDKLVVRSDGSVQVVSDGGPGADMTLETDRSEGPLQLGIWQPGPVQLGLIYKAKGERPAATVVLGAYDFENAKYPVYEFPVEWVTLAQTDEPGARVTIARVWRGGQAIPSLEGAVVTTVGKDGRIRFPRVAGEPASTLRMLVQRKQGMSFHEVRIAKPVDASPVIEFTINDDGTVRSGKSKWNALGEPMKAMQGIAAAIREHKPAVERVVIRAHRDATWDALACVLFGAVKAEVRAIRHYAVHDDYTGTPRIAFVDNDLAADRGLAPGAPPDILEGAAVILLRRHKDGRLHVRLRTGQETVSVALPDAPDINIRNAIVGALGETVKGKVGTIRIIPATRDAPAWLVQVALEAFHAAGATQVLFDAPAPSQRGR